MRWPILLAGLWIPCLCVVHASGRRVPLWVPDAYPTVQAAIDAASDGDVIEVGAGEYRGPIVIDDKSIQLVARLGDARPRILVDGDAPAVVVRDVRSWRCRIVGFEIRATNGIRVERASPTIRGNAIIGSGGAGTGVACDDAAPVVVDNEISGFGASAIRCVRSDATIVGNSIRRNRAERGGGVYIESGAPRLERNTIVENAATLEGGGVFASDPASLVSERDTIARNRAAVGGGITVAGGAFVVRECIVYSNVAPRARSIFVGSGASGLVARCCIERGWPGAENFDADPQFVDVAHGDYGLAYRSPCRARGNPPIDVGAVPYGPRLTTVGDPVVAVRVVGEPGESVFLAASADVLRSRSGSVLSVDLAFTSRHTTTIGDDGWTDVPLTGLLAHDVQGDRWVQAWIGDRDLTNVVRVR